MKEKLEAIMKAWEHNVTRRPALAYEIQQLFIATKNYIHRQEQAEKQKEVPYLETDITP